ncbi:MAG: MmgE/PrpD family protein [Eubacterium sp.]|nr:MmgE/PrpD family protein [Eubacterium sp.]
MTKNDENLTDLFLEGLEKKASSALPEEVIYEAKLSLIDYISCAYLGSSMLREKNESMLGFAGNDSGNSVLIGSGRKVSTHMAAFMNGINAHVAELDDGHRYGMMHGGAPVISVLLAVSGAHKISSDKFILGMVMGYEAAIRLAAAVQPGHKLKGCHATGTCGTVGAAMAVAFALDFTHEQKKAALSAALTDAAGLLEMIDNVSTLKPYNIGRAAVAGLDAAFAGISGFSGPYDAMGGKRGFLQLYAGENINYSHLLSGFEDKYEIQMIYRKPYAACRHCHAAIEAAMVDAIDNNLKPEEIKEIDIKTYGLAVGGHDHKEISGTSSAKMSTPFSVAAAICCGKAGFQQFEEPFLSDDRIRKLMDKVEVSEDPELSKLVPDKRGAIATLKTDKGEFTVRVDYPKGEPENPVTEKEMNEKFHSLLGAAGISEDKIEKMLSTVWNVDKDYAAVLDILE